MLVIAGLGNPGAKYEKNRHNIGFMTVTALAEHWRFGPWRKRFHADVAEGEIARVKCLVMKPQLFYNESGRSVGEAAGFFKLKPTEVVVFYDEIDLAPGRFRMKTGGGAAGNNGIRSIAASPIGDGFRRARLGVGHPGRKELVHAHVLGDFHKAEEAWVTPLIDACVQAAALLAAGEDEKYQGEVLRLAPAEKKPARPGKPPDDGA